MSYIRLCRLITKLWKWITSHYTRSLKNHSLLKADWLKAAFVWRWFKDCSASCDWSRLRSSSLHVTGSVRNVDAFPVQWRKGGTLHVALAPETLVARAFRLADVSSAWVLNFPDPLAVDIAGEELVTHAAVPCRTCLKAVVDVRVTVHLDRILQPSLYVNNILQPQEKMKSVCQQWHTMCESRHRYIRGNFIWHSRVRWPPKPLVSL